MSDLHLEQVLNSDEYYCRPGAIHEPDENPDMGVNMSDGSHARPGFRGIYGAARTVDLWPSLHRPDR